MNCWCVYIYDCSIHILNTFSHFQDISELNYDVCIILGSAQQWIESRHIPFNVMLSSFLKKHIKNSFVVLLPTALLISNHQIKTEHKRGAIRLREETREQVKLGVHLFHRHKLYWHNWGDEFCRKIGYSSLNDYWIVVGYVKHSVCENKNTKKLEKYQFPIIRSQPSPHHPRP